AREILRIRELTEAHLVRNRVSQAHIVLVLGALGARGREIEPDVRGDVVGRNTQALVVHQAEQMLRRRIALLGAAAVPIERQRVALRYAAPILVHEAEVALCARVAALSREPETCGGARIVAA